MWSVIRAEACAVNARTFLVWCKAGCYKVSHRRGSRRFQCHGATYKTSVLGLKMVVTADEKAVRRLLQASQPRLLCQGWATQAQAQVPRLPQAFRARL